MSLLREVGGYSCNQNDFGASSQRDDNNRADVLSIAQVVAGNAI